jgi:hypothetical protein
MTVLPSQPCIEPEQAQQQEDYNELQRELCVDSEIIENAKQLWIQNFYKFKTGEL